MPPRRPSPFTTPPTSPSPATSLDMRHIGHRTSEDSYNQARSIEASTSLNAVLEQRRNRGDRSRRKA